MLGAVRFASPLTPQDHILLADADTLEQYVIKGFVFNGAAYQQVSTLGWDYLYCSGQMGQLPDSRWPTWIPSSGTLTSPVSTALDEPLVVLTPGGNIDRIQLTKVPGGSGTLEIQFVSETTSSTGPQLVVRRSDPDLVLSWPAIFSNLNLFASSSLTAPNWAAVTNAPVLSGGRLTVSTSMPGGTRFFRLQ